MATRNAGPLAFRLAKEVPIRGEMTGKYDEGTQLWVHKENSVRAPSGSDEVVSSEWISNTLSDPYVTEVDGQNLTDIDHEVDYEQDMDYWGGGWGDDSSSY